MKPLFKFLLVIIIANPLAMVVFSVWGQLNYCDLPCENTIYQRLVFTETGFQWVSKMLQLKGILNDFQRILKGF